jgi:hypothetical protein
MSKVLAFASYIKDRLNERSTWLLFGAAITAAAALSWPWSLASCVVGCIAALIPDGPVK